MKPARILVLAVALVAGLAAAMLASTSKTPEAVVQPPPPVPTEGVLVAANELFRGDILGENNMRWVDWPAEKIPEGCIRKSTSLGAIAELKGAKIRTNLAAGEPLRRERVALGPHSGFIASDLPPGKRAVAINIDTQGSSTAGGFILPDDTVDVIHIFQDEHFAHTLAGNALVSQTILSNVRVLAIGQNVQVNNGERVVTGSNATLEVTPGQAETLLLAQRTGSLTLILRSMSDANMASDKNKHVAGGFMAVDVGGAKRSKVR